MIRVCLVGLGNIGIKYDSNRPSGLTHYSAIKKSLGFELVACVDESYLVLTEMADKLHGINLFNSIRKVDTGLDLIVIATPMSSHLGNFLESILRKPKLILIEKPPAKSVEELIIMAAEGEKAQIPTYVNYQRAAFPATRSILTKVQSGSLGSYFEVTAVFTGDFLNNGSHLINLLSHIFLSERDSFHLRQLSNSSWAMQAVNLYAVINASLSDASELHFIAFSKTSKIVYSSSEGSFKVYRLSKSPSFELGFEFIEEQAYLQDESSLIPVYSELKEAFYGNRCSLPSLTESVSQGLLMAKCND
jgi:predicted dehydrogenase